MINYKLHSFFIGFFILISSFISAQCDIDLNIDYDPTTGIATASWNLPSNASNVTFNWTDQTRRTISTGVTTRSSTSIKVPPGTTTLFITICYTLKEDGHSDCCSAELVIVEDITFEPNKNDVEENPCEQVIKQNSLLDIMDCDNDEIEDVYPFYHYKDNSPNDNYDDKTCRKIITKCDKLGMVKNEVGNSPNHNISKSVNNTELICPNPFTDELNIKIESRFKSEIFIYNALGKLIIYQELEPNTPNTKFNTSDIHSGLYLYRIISNGKLLKAGKLLK
jgi:Secretion system C-terminal sorting domain